MNETATSIEELIEYLTTSVHEFRLVSTQEKTYRSLVLEIHVWPSEDAPHQVWHILCKNLWTRGEISETACRCCLRTEHPLLWQFTYPEMTLYFHGKPDSVENVIGELYRVHFEMVGKALPFERFFSPVFCTVCWKGAWNAGARPGAAATRL